MRHLLDSLSRHPSQSNSRRVSRLDRHYLNLHGRLLPGLPLETLHLSSRQLTLLSHLILLQAAGHLDLHLPVPRSVHSRWHLYYLHRFLFQDPQVPHHNNLPQIRSVSVRVLANPRLLLYSRALRLTMGEHLRRRRDNLEHPRLRCRHQAVVVQFSRWVPLRRRQRHYPGNARSRSYQRVEMPTPGDERHRSTLILRYHDEPIFLHVAFPPSISKHMNSIYVGSHFPGHVISRAYGFNDFFSSGKLSSRQFICF